MTMMVCTASRNPLNYYCIYTAVPIFIFPSGNVSYRFSSPTFESNNLKYRRKEYCSLSSIHRSESAHITISLSWRLLVTPPEDSLFITVTRNTTVDALLLLVIAVVVNATISKPSSSHYCSFLSVRLRYVHGKKKHARPGLTPQDIAPPLQSRTRLEHISS